MVLKSFVLLCLLELLPFLFLIIDLRIFGLIQLLEEHLHQLFVVSRGLFMANNGLNIKSASHDESFSDNQFYLDSHLSSLYLQLALFLEVFDEMITENLQFCVDAHLILELVKEFPIYFLDPKGRVAICYVQCRIVLFLLLFDEEKVVQLAYYVLFVRIIDQFKDINLFLRVWDLLCFHKQSDKLLQSLLALPNTIFFPLESFRQGGSIYYQRQDMKNLILQEIKLLKREKSIRARPQKEIVKQDTASEKSSISAKSSKTQSSSVPRSGMDIFKGMKFCFPVANLDLSPKRIEIISKIIENEGGKVFVFQDKPFEEAVDYLLISPSTKIEMVLHKVATKIEFKEILDFNLILKSSREGVLLSIEQHCLYKEKTEEQCEKEVIQQPRKANKVENEAKLHYFTQKMEVKASEMTDDEQDDAYAPTQIKTKSSENVQIGSLISSCKRLLGKEEKPKYHINKDTFLCQKSITQDSIEKFSMNKFICEELMKLQKIYESQKDIGRKIAYLKAVSAIKSLNFEIESENDLDNVRGIGKKIVDKVKELIRTGRLEKLEKLQQCERNKVETDFCKIWGIGPSKSQQLYRDGIKTIEQLRERTDLLNKNQRLGLKYYEDFLIKIPREKITRIFQKVKEIFSRMVDSIDNYNLVVCGSYRRGKEKCGDIDIIVSRKDGHYEKKLLLDFILQLESVGLLTDHLQFPSGMQQKSSLSYMGVCKFEDEIHHRIDIKYYPIEEYAYALLYFTGSDMFNRSMRLYARKVGLQLSDHGANARRDEKTGVIWENPIPFCSTEEEIFKFMELDYRSPQEREV